MNLYDIWDKYTIQIEISSIELFLTFNKTVFEISYLFPPKTPTL